MRQAAIVVACLIVSACGSAWTESELRAAQLVGACDRVAEVARDWRPDQAAQVTAAARSISVALANPIPDLDAISRELAVLDAGLAGLATGPDLYARTHEAQMAALALRVELVRRWHRFPVRLTPRL